ncbi:SRPBCC family protein [Hymenobacter tenuis]
MKSSRIRTLLIGLTAGVVYAFLMMLVVNSQHRNVSVAYIFVLPLVLGAIPVLFSTKEQLQLYKTDLLTPWAITITFFFLSLINGFEGMICLVIIIGPFVLLGSLGAFIYRLLKLKRKSSNNLLYMSLLMPLAVLLLESNMELVNQVDTVETKVVIHASQESIWENVKNVRNIKPSEIEPHFVHLIGVPKPLDGQLSQEGVGGVRSITWEKGIKFREIIKTWDNGNGFSYDIDVDPLSIPPKTLDEHVMIGGKYFDVIAGSYKIENLSQDKSVVTLTCTYRVTTNLNFYSRLWANFILDDFNQMILEVIKKRSEASGLSSNQI